MLDRLDMKNYFSVTVNKVVMNHSERASLLRELPNARGLGTSMVSLHIPSNTKL